MHSEKKVSGFRFQVSGVRKQMTEFRYYRIPEEGDYMRILHPIPYRNLMPLTDT